MTPRKETEPTKEQKAFAAEIIGHVYHDCPGECLRCERVDGMAVMLARRDEARDAETRKRTLQAFAEFIRTNAIGLITAESVARVADGQALLSQPASPSPASSEPCDGEKP